jgi:hypothetical protein
MVVKRKKNSDKNYAKTILLLQWNGRFQFFVSFLDELQVLNRQFFFNTDPFQSSIIRNWVCTYVDEIFGDLECVT